MTEPEFDPLGDWPKGLELRFFLSLWGLVNCQQYNESSACLDNLDDFTLDTMYAATS